MVISYITYKYGVTEALIKTVKNMNTISYPFLHELCWLYLSYSIFF